MNIEKMNKESDSNEMINEKKNESGDENEVVENINEGDNNTELSLVNQLNFTEEKIQEKTESTEQDTKTSCNINSSTCLDALSSSIENDSSKVLTASDTTASNELTCSEEISIESCDASSESVSAVNNVENQPDEEIDTTSNAGQKKSGKNNVEEKLFGEYFNVRTYEEVLDILEDYQERTSSHFVIQGKTKNFGVTGLDADIKGHGILWKDPIVAGNTIKSFDMPYDGIPRITVGHFTLACQYGADSALGKKEKYKAKNRKRVLEGEDVKTRNLKIPSKKCGCPAKITIKQLVKYPQYKTKKKYSLEQRRLARELKQKLETNREEVLEEHHFVGRLVDPSEHKFHTIPMRTEWRKRNAASKLRKKLQGNVEDLVCEDNFTFRLPDISEHKYHTLSKDPKIFREPVHKDLAIMIKELYLDGLKNAEICEEIKRYVLTDMFHNQIPPSLDRRRYFPNLQDVRNLVTSVRNISRCSESQEQYILKTIEKLKNKDENLNIHFHVEVQENKNVKAPTSDDEFFEPDDESIVSPKKKKKNDTLKKGCQIRTYLFCFQTPKHQRLMKRFGNVAFLSEVIIRSERKRKAVPFHVYNLLVQTNVDYQTVGCIVVSREMKHGLVDGLNVLKDWNTYWRPKYFVVDCDDEINNAVETLFPETQYFISPDSCERKWDEYLSKPSNELSDQKEEIMTYLKNMAYSFTEDSLTIAAALFEGSSVWRRSDLLRTWFQSNWLHCAKKWVFGYRPEDLMLTSHLKVNIQESLGNYEKLLMQFVGNKHCVSTFIEKAVEVAAVKDQLDYNKRTCNGYSECNNFVLRHKLPKQFEGIPNTVVPYVYDLGMLSNQHEFEIAHNQLGLFTVKCDNDSSNTEEFSIEKTITSDNTEVSKSEDDKSSEYLQAGEYTVSFGDLQNFPFCTCTFWQIHKLPCVHMFAIFKETPGWKYDMLSPLYRSSNLFISDLSCFKDQDLFSQSLDKQCQTTRSYHPSDVDFEELVIFKNAQLLPADIYLHQHLKEVLHHLNKISCVFTHGNLLKNLRQQLEKLITQNIDRMAVKNASRRLTSTLTTNEKPDIQSSQPSSLLLRPNKKKTATVPLFLKSPKDKENKNEKTFETKQIVTSQENLQNVIENISKENPNATVKVVTKERAQNLRNPVGKSSTEHVVNVKVVNSQSPVEVKRQSALKISVPVGWENIDIDFATSNTNNSEKVEEKPNSSVVLPPLEHKVLPTQVAATSTIITTPVVAEHHQAPVVFAMKHSETSTSDCEEESNASVKKDAKKISLPDFTSNSGSHARNELDKIVKNSIKTPEKVASRGEIDKLTSSSSDTGSNVSPPISVKSIIATLENSKVKINVPSPVTSEQPLPAASEKSADKPTFKTETRFCGPASKLKNSGVVTRNKETVTSSSPAPEIPSTGLATIDKAAIVVKKPSGTVSKLSTIKHPKTVKIATAMCTVSNIHTTTTPRVSDTGETKARDVTALVNQVSSSELSISVMKNPISTKYKVIPFLTSDTSTSSSQQKTSTDNNSTVSHRQSRRKRKSPDDVDKEETSTDNSTTNVTHENISDKDTLESQSASKKGRKNDSPRKSYSLRK